MTYNQKSICCEPVGLSLSALLQAAPSGRESTKKELWLVLIEAGVGFGDPNQLSQRRAQSDLVLLSCTNFEFSHSFLPAHGLRQQHVLNVLLNLLLRNSGDLLHRAGRKKPFPIKVPTDQSRRILATQVERHVSFCLCNGLASFGNCNPLLELHSPPGTNNTTGRLLQHPSRRG